ncbi:MAG: hypothetical protein F7B60_06610 [Desulfurococcales archaeon]|nr:hypothetical protein [Desulfurococcales archaeon]
MLKENRFKGNILCIDKTLPNGGLMSTNIINGFTFDTGGSHVIFSRNEGILSFMLELLERNNEKYIKHHRNSYVYLENNFVPYPFENGIWVLNEKSRYRILSSFIVSLIENSCKTKWRPNNLLEWIYGTFGKEIGDMYLIPYNEKIWKRNLADIDSDWVYTPGRLPLPNWQDVIKAGVGLKTEGYTEQAIFYYPYKGGIRTLFNSIYRQISSYIKILPKTKIERIKFNGDYLIINNKIRSKEIISTIPLNELLRIIDIDKETKRLSSMLDYNSVAVVAVALRGNAPKMHWVYVPDKTIIFHRYAWISNYSPMNAPRNNSSIIVEVTLKPNDTFNQNYIESKVLEGLKSIGILDESERNLLFIRSWYNKYGYPIYRKGHKVIRNRITSRLKELKILPFGRWGLWHYWNMDKILIEARNLLIKRLNLF